MNVFVHDAYLAGEGILHASLLGVVTLAELAQLAAELVTPRAKPARAPEKVSTGQKKPSQPFCFVIETRLGVTCTDLLSA
jgi:hypothetical protein